MMKFFRYLMPLAAVFMMVACVDNTTPDGPEPEPQPQPQPQGPSAAHVVSVMNIVTENGAPAVLT